MQPVMQDAPESKKSEESNGLSAKPHAGILRATAITGGSKIISLLSNFGKLKIAAVLGGAIAVGEMGLYTSALALVAAISSLGIGTSAVRIIAAHDEHENDKKLGAKISSVLSLSWINAVVAATICLTLAPYLSLWTFGNYEKASHFRLLAVCAFLTQLTEGKLAILKGLRQVKRLARQSLLDSLISLLTAAIVFAAYGAEAVLLLLLCGSIISQLSVSILLRRIHPRDALRTEGMFVSTVRNMLPLGLSHLTSNLIWSTVYYYVAILLQEHWGLAANGQYQALWMFTGVSVGFVLAAMGQDFYPRLVGSIDDNERTRELMSAQIEVGLLFVGPGIAFLSAVSEIIIPIIYSAEFAESGKALPIFLLGALGRVATWPFGYFLLAKGRGRSYLLAEAFCCVSYLVITSLMVKTFGIIGLGAAFSGAYLLYWFMMLFTFKKITGLTIHPRSIVTTALTFLLVPLAHGLGPVAGTMLACAAMLISISVMVKSLPEKGKIRTALDKVKSLRMTQSL